MYLLKSKDQVFQNFQQFHAMVERKTGKPLKCLRTDNGGEYISHEFKEYCSKHGIRHEKTVPGTPQHNGVAERMNRTIVEKVRCMLRTAKLPKSFWGAAVLTACYLINRSPSAPLGFDVPEKVWTCKEISYNHLKVFGCKAFIHVPKEQRSKLDDKALPCIFIGYGNEEFGYKVWDPKTRKVIRSRDVVFHEDQTMKDSNKEEQQSEKVTMNITINPPYNSQVKKMLRMRVIFQKQYLMIVMKRAYRHRSMMIRGSSLQDRRMNNRSSEDQTVSTSQVPDIHPQNIFC